MRAGASKAKTKVPLMKRLAFALVAFAATSAFAANPPELQKQFQDQVQPFVGKYCAACHGGPKAAAQFDLKS